MLARLRNAVSKSARSLRVRICPYSNENLYLTYPDHEVLPWIQEVASERNKLRLYLICYYARGNKLDELKRQGQLRGDGDFADLAHYIGRLGAHRYAASMILTVALNDPVL